MSAFNIGGLLNMGVGALFASQAWIQTTGNNISNVNTVGYTRQGVNLSERVSIDSRPGQVGQGVEATEVFRYFNKFVESSYIDRYSYQRRYEEEYDLLTNVEALFNEANMDGISAALSEMFTAWNTLSKNPDSEASRAALLESMRTFTGAVRNADASMADLQDQMNRMIAEQVDKANTLIREIADLNREINAHTIEGRNNANAMMDERDAKVRELSGILDVHVDDKGAGNYTVTTGSGMLLVQESIPYSLEMRGPQSSNSLTAESVYDGTVGFTGADGYEYTLQIVDAGTVDTSGAPVPPAGTATYRLSLDGGKSWVLDEVTGQPKLFYATDQENSAHVKDLDIYFTGTSALSAGDTFTITPKSDVFWVSPTAGPIDISTQINQDGTDNTMRITGGAIAGMLEFRDYRIGEYRDRLAGFSDTLTWEMNRIHSQGGGLEKLASILGDYAAANTNVALGSRSSGNHWFDRLQSGNVTFAIYDATTGANIIPYPGIEAFSGTNFDPARDSLADVVAAINGGAAGAYITASIVNNRLSLTARGEYTFGITADTSGLAAALGINTILTGESPTSLGVNPYVLGNLNLVNAGRLNGTSEVNEGDNIIAREIAALASKQVDIGVADGHKIRQSIPDYFGSLVAKVGADTSSVKFTAATQRTMATELNERRESLSGVNLDEEMSNLIKFQASYKAAAKMITTADEMLQTLLSLKQ